MVNSPLNEFHGVWTALATPFRDDLEIDWDAFEQLLKAQQDAKVTGVVIAGTTGESPTLTVQEKLALVRRARAFLSPTVRVMAGTGDNNTKQSIELSRLAQDAGADSLLIVTPPYNKPSVAGLTLHYKMIADAVRLPICLYHVPGRTAQFLTVEQLFAVTSAVPRIRSVKEASADVAFFSRALLKTGLDFLSGDDPTYLASLAVGGKGVISVVSNVFPAEMVALTDAFAKGETARARAIHDALLPAIDVLFCEVNPCPAKAALQYMKLCKNTLRPPLAPVTAAIQEKIEGVLVETRQRLATLSR